MPTVNGNNIDTTVTESVSSYVARKQKELESLQNQINLLSSRASKVIVELSNVAEQIG